jgi:hypothetical protein
MGTITGICTLIIDGERYVGFQYAIETSTSGRSWGFLNGVQKVLKRARILRDVQLHVAGDDPRDSPF